MASKATSERRRGLHKALLIAAWLATVLVAGPVLAQEEEVVAPTGAIAEPEATPAATTDEAPGDGYQDGGIGGVLIPLEVTPAETASGQEPDPNSGQPSGVTPDNADAAQEGQSPDDLTGDQNPAQQAALAAEQAAQEARLGASDAEEAAQSTLQQSSATPEDVEFAQRAAQEAQLAASDAEEAAEAAQQAAAREDAPAAEEAAREAQQATQEAQQASGAVQQVAQQAAQQAVDTFGGTEDIKDAYTKALQAARSAGDKGDSAALAAESDAGKGANTDPEKGSSSTSEEAAGENEEAASGKGVRNGATGEVDPEENVGESGSNTMGITKPAQQGDFPLLLGGGAILAAGVFVAARKLIWS
jgi:hypothetical protein